MPLEHEVQLPLAADAPASNDAIREILLFDEHTWGAAGPERDELRSLGSGGLQWSYKASHGYRAAAKTTAQRGAVLHTLGETVATGPYPTVLVVNTLAHARSGVVEVELPRQLGLGDDDPLTLVDTATDTVLPYEWIPAGRHDRARMRFVVPEVPGFGHRKVELRREGDQPGKRFGKRAEGLGEPIIENRFYRITFDPIKAGITSIIDRRTGRELVDAAAPYALNTYIYDHYVKDDERPINHRLILRHVPARAEVVGLERSPIDTCLLYRVRGGEGGDWVHSRIRLYDHLPWIEIENVIDKRRVPHKEGAYFSFPFRSGERVHYDIPGGTCILGEEQLPGALTDWPVVEAGVWIEGAEQQTAWATVDACLVQFGRIATVQPPRPPLEINGHIYSYVLNNLWSTNFAPWQSGHLLFRYRIQSGGVQDAREFARFGQAALHPLVAEVIPPHRPGVELEAAAQWVDVSGEGVVVESMVPAEAGGILLRLREALGQPTSASVRLTGRNATEAAVTMPTEEPIEQVTVADGVVRVELGPRQVVNVRMR